MGRMTTRFLFFNFHTPDVLDRIGPDGGLGQRRFRGLWVVQHDARVQGQEASGRGDERIDVNFLDPRLLDDQLAEAHQQLFQRGDVHRGASAHALARR